MADLARGPSSCILMSERGTCCGGRTPRRQGGVKGAMRGSLLVVHAHVCSSPCKKVALAAEGEPHVGRAE